MIRIGDWAICCHCKTWLRFGVHPDGRFLLCLTTRQERMQEAPANLAELARKLPSVRYRKETSSAPRR